MTPGLVGAEVARSVDVAEYHMVRPALRRHLGREATHEEGTAAFRGYLAECAPKALRGMGFTVDGDGDEIRRVTWPSGSTVQDLTWSQTVLLCDRQIRRRRGDA